MDDIKETILEYRFFKEAGNVRLIIDNPSGFPFWYTIVKDKKVIGKGHTTALDYSPKVAIFGKSVAGKNSNNKRYDISGVAPRNATGKMEWSIWKDRMGPDSIEYYKFLYPEICYSYSEKAPGEVTQIAPYVLIDGEPQGVHILWIDAQLSLPQFAILDDSLNVIDRLTNHLDDTVTIRRAIEWKENKSEKSITLLKSFIDTIPLSATKPDSITITYSMTMENGYFDGERRSIPVFRPGILESHGEFAVLGDTVSRRFQTNPALGKVMVHAHSSAMQSFLDEIERIDCYPYLCNEQVASKIKVLLLKKHILSMFDREFKEDHKIRSLIRRLERNRNRDNL